MATDSNAANVDEGLLPGREETRILTGSKSKREKLRERSKETVGISMQQYDFLLERIEKALDKRDQKIEALEWQIEELESSYDDLRGESQGALNEAIDALQKRFEARLDAFDSTTGVRLREVGEAATILNVLDGKIASIDGVKPQLEEFRNDIGAIFARLKTVEIVADKARGSNVNIFDVLDAEKRKRESLEATVEDLKTELTLCKRALANGGGVGTVGVQPRKRAKAPEPKGYDGARDAQEVDNFLWQMERYFEALKIDENEEKIQTATLYLRDTAALWWRRRHADLERGLCSIGTWDEFKKELKKQFYPENVEFEAFRKLRRLRHTGSLRDYVKEYSATILEIPDMPDREALYGFMDGLQGWAAQELRRSKVQDLASAMAAVEKLDDYRKVDKPKGSKIDRSSSGADRRSEHKRAGTPKPSDDESSGDGRKKKSGKSGDKDHERRKKSSNFKCFLCNGPHMIRDCPQKNALNALVQCKGMEDSSDSEGQMGAIRVLATMVKTVEGRMGTPNDKPGKGLPYVEGCTNGRDLQALVDTGAGTSLVSPQEARRLGLTVTKETGWIKAVNSEAKPIHGVARDVEMSLGDWKGKANFTVAEVDDHDMVLGMDFMRKAKAVPIPHLNAMYLLAGKGPALVPLLRKPKSKEIQFGALELVEGTHMDEQVFAHTFPLHGFVRGEGRTYADVLKFGPLGA